MATYKGDAGHVKKILLRVTIAEKKLAEKRAGMRKLTTSEYIRELIKADILFEDVRNLIAEERGRMVTKNF